MAAMIGRRKRGLRSVFSFEHSGRMRHTDEKHCIFARIRRVRYSIRRKILRNFPLPAPTRLTVMYEIVTDFGRDHDFIPLVWECLRDQLFAETVSVRVSSIEQSDTEVECLVHQRDRFAL